MEILTFLYTKNKYGYFDSSTGVYREFEPLTLPMLFCEWFDTVQDKTRIVWMTSMKLLTNDLIKTVLRSGYNDVTGNNTPLSKWHFRDFDYTVSADGNIYRMRFALRGKKKAKTMTIFNADNMLGKDIDAITRDFLGEPESGNRLHDYTMAVYRAIFRLVGNQTKNVPFTISMLAQRHWKKAEGMDYGDKEFLVNCYELQTPDGQNLDEFIRQSYRPGFLLLTSAAFEHNDGGGIILDRNSLYPYEMVSKDIPWGTPEYFTGEIPEEVSTNPRCYYFVKLRCKFKLKAGYLPYITINDWRYQWGIPLEDSDYRDRDGNRISETVDEDGVLNEVKADLVLAKTDWEIMQEAYDIEGVEFFGGCYFRTTRFAFNDYIDPLYEGKRVARENGQRAEVRVNKMLMNGLAGTLAKIRDRQTVRFEFDKSTEELRVKDIMKTRSSKTKSHIHMASAILAYARADIYRDAVKCGSRFLYSDTDSLHLSGTEVPDFLKISDKLGDYKIEHKFTKAVYFKRKMYGIIEDGKIYLTVAGLSKEYKEFTERILNYKDDPATYRGRIAFTWGMPEIRGYEETETIEVAKAAGCDTGESEDIEIRTKVAREIRNFENDMLNTPLEDRLAKIKYTKVPNGIRECRDFQATTYTRFFYIDETDRTEFTRLRVER